MARTKYTRRADGRLVTTRTDPRTGKRIYFYGYTSRDIELKILEYNTAVEQGRPFEVVAAEWWEEISDTIAASTLKGYKAAYKRAISEFGDVPIRKITPQNIRNYLKRLVRDGYTTKTVKTYLQVVRQICEYAITCDNCDLDYNPCLRVTLPEGKASTHRQAVSPADEAAIRTHPNEWLLPYMMLYTGLRRGEILALQGTDIDLDNLVIHVTKSADYTHHRRAEIKRPKSAAGVRNVPILKPLLSALADMELSEKYLFSEDGGKTPLTEWRFSELWQAYCDKLGISATPHQLRHSYATMLNEHGVDLKTAQYWLGHATAAMTQDVYTHIRDSKLRQDAILLNEKLKV